MGQNTYTTPGATTWTVPSDASEAILEAWGGGGNGANAVILGFGGGGGGGGEYSTVTIPVTPGQVYDVTVGGATGDSYVQLSAVDKVRGTAGTDASGSTHGTGGSGGTGSLHVGANGFTSVSNDGGGGGGAGSESANGTAGSGTTGGTFGGGSGGINGGAKNGVAGTAPGGGGGGGAEPDGLLGAGARGQVRITWYLVTTQTITGQSRITTQTTQTLTGQSRVTVATTQTITGISTIVGNMGIVIGSTDVYEGRLYDGAGSPVSFTLPRGQRGTATIQLILGPYDPFMPVLGNPVSIYSYGVRVFAGSVDHVERSWIGQDGYAVVTVSCVSFEQVFDMISIYPPRAYVNKTAGYILTDLFNTFCLGSPVRLGTIQDGANMPPKAYSGDRISDVFAELALVSDFVQGVDPSDITQYFRPQSTNSAPFVLNVGDIQWESAGWEQNRADFRDRQLTRMSYQQHPPSNVLFAGDDSTTIFSIPYLPNELTRVNLTTGTQGTAVCTFTGQPADGDYTVIGIGLANTRYTFVTALDNTQPNQVLIGANTAGSCQNLADAINANPATIGIAFSFPTLEDPIFNADDLSGTTFPIHVKQTGANHTLVDLTSSAAFSWGSVVDGTDGTDDPDLRPDHDYTWPTVD